MSNTHLPQLMCSSHGLWIACLSILRGNCYWAEVKADANCKDVIDFSQCCRSGCANVLQIIAMKCYLPTGTADSVDACKSFRPGGSCCQPLPASQPEGSIKSGRSATAAPGWLITTAVASLPPAGTYKVVVVYYPAVIVVLSFLGILDAI